MSKFKEIREEKKNTKFLHDSSKPTYVYASKQTKLKDSTN